MNKIIDKEKKLRTSILSRDESLYTKSWVGDSANIYYLKLNDGISIRYLKTGNGKPLTLVHTMRTQLDYFQKVISGLAKNYTVYAVDLPGHDYHRFVNPNIFSLVGIKSSIK